MLSTGPKWCDFNSSPKVQNGSGETRVGRRSILAAFGGANLGGWFTCEAQESEKEIPVPPIETALGSMPDVGELPVRADMPPVMVMNDGTPVKSRAAWRKRKEEIRRTLAYYAVGRMPPPPGNVKGRVVKTESGLDSGVRYRLVELTFGPGGKLSLN
ncbi:MAG TPA: hypothetical protein PLZ95_22705, partial [Bryobacteraceae bacterium]|nr:hypothetical protein [Bryobacteraceae bacterium]